MTDTMREIRVDAASGKTQVWEYHRPGWYLVPESRLTAAERAAVTAATTASEPVDGWTPREPNDGGFATDRRSRGRIGGVRRER